MKIITSKPVNYNGNDTILNIIEFPKSGKINLPKNSLGYYVGTDGQLYKPVITFGNIYMDKETLRDFIWHAIRYIQKRDNEEQNHDFFLELTRRYYQMHAFLVGEDKYDERLVKAICEIEGLNLLLEVKKEEQKLYRAHPKNLHFKIAGKTFDLSDLIEALSDAGRWFSWEAQQPDQKYREGDMIQMAVAAFYSSRIFWSVKKYIPEIISELINRERKEEDQIPMQAIKKMMKTCEIPVSKKKQCA